MWEDEDPREPQVDKLSGRSNPLVPFPNKGIDSLFSTKVNSNGYAITEARRDYSRWVSIAVENRFKVEVKRRNFWCNAGAKPGDPQSFRR